MTCESCDGTCSEDACESVAAHRDGDRALDGIVRLSEDADLYEDGEPLPGLARLMERASAFDDEPTHEKWRRGQSWR